MVELSPLASVAFVIFVMNLSAISQATLSFKVTELDRVYVRYPVRRPIVQGDRHEAALAVVRKSGNGSAECSLKEGNGGSRQNRGISCISFSYHFTNPFRGQPATHQP